MVLRFLCPNGHKIQCPQEHAGRAGRCPQCGVKFRIPQLSEFESFGADAGDAAPVELIDSGIGSSGSRVDLAAPAARERQMDFLCPNGHRLHGPANLQGRTGECPECGAKFRIPSYEVPEESAIGARGKIVRGRANGRNDSVLDSTREQPPQTPPRSDAAPLPRADRAPTSATPTPPKRASASRASASHAAASPAHLFAELWSRKPEGGKVELRLTNGDSLVPDAFSKSLSHGTHGIFAIRQPDGLYSIHAIAWRNVAQILLRDAKDLPKGMAE